MITPHRLLISVLLLFAGVSYATDSYCSKEFEILERHKKHDYKMVNRVLTDLKCNDTFEGKYFKLVKGTENDAISFDIDDQILKMRAANVYYHLTVARDFWVNEIKSKYVRDQKQIVIRLNILNSFSKQRHFKNEDQEKNYNNAWTIPEGEEPVFVPNRDIWGKEIWFSPMKKILSRELYKSKGNNPIHESLKIVKDPLVSNTQNGIIYTGLGLLAVPTFDGSGFLNAILKRVGTIAVLFGMIELSKHLDHWFIQKYYYVDSAMVPEIIYHEYAHIALSDTLKTTHSVPVIEGLADYFAARISNRRKVYDSIKGLSSNNAKDTDKNSVYHPYIEGWWNAQSDFTLSLLWLGRNKFNELNQKRLDRNLSIMVDYDQLIYAAHFKINEEANIAKDLTKALIETCNEICNSKRAGLNTLHQTFEEKGMN